MTFTQTISTEYHPCESLPVVFGAPCSATSPLSGSLQAVCADLPAANAASHRSTSATTNLAGTNQTAPPASPSANAPSNPAPDHLRWSRWFEKDGTGNWESLDRKWWWNLTDAKWSKNGECADYAAYSNLDHARSFVPTLPPPSPVAEALAWDEVKSRRGVYLTDRFMFPESRYASDGNGSVLYYHIGLGIGPRGCDDGCDCIALPNETIPPHVAAKFPQPAPAVEQAGTVDAKWVREHAGEYEFAGELGDAPGTIIAAKGKYVSDGNGHVKFFGTMAGLELNGATLKTHPDIAKEPSPLARFRPLPSPSANPPETPDSSGEPVNPWGEDSSKTWREYSAWNRARDEFRTYHTAQLSTAQSDAQAMMTQRDEARRELDTVMADYQDAAVRLAEAEAQLSALRAELATLTRERDAARNEARAAGALIDTFVYDRSEPTNPDRAAFYAKQDRLDDEWRSVRTDFIAPAKSEKGGAA